MGAWGMVVEGSEVVFLAAQVVWFGDATVALGGVGDLRALLSLPRALRRRWYQRRALDPVSETLLTQADSLDSVTEWSEADDVTQVPRLGWDEEALAAAEAHLHPDSAASPATKNRAVARIFRVFREPIMDLYYCKEGAWEHLEAFDALVERLGGVPALLAHQLRDPLASPRRKRLAVWTSVYLAHVFWDVPSAVGFLSKVLSSGLGVELTKALGSEAPRLRSAALFVLGGLAQSMSQAAALADHPDAPAFCAALLPSLTPLIGPAERVQTRNWACEAFAWLASVRRPWVWATLSAQPELLRSVAEHLGSREGHVSGLVNLHNVLCFLLGNHDIGAVMAALERAGALRALAGMLAEPRGPSASGYNGLSYVATLLMVHHLPGTPLMEALAGAGTLGLLAHVGGPEDPRWAHHPQPLSHRRVNSFLRWAQYDQTYSELQDAARLVMRLVDVCSAKEVSRLVFAGCLAPVLRVLWFSDFPGEGPLAVGPLEPLRTLAVMLEPESSDHTWPPLFPHRLPPHELALRRRLIHDFLGGGVVRLVADLAQHHPEEAVREAAGRVLGLLGPSPPVAPPALRPPPAHSRLVFDTASVHPPYV